MSGKWDHTLNLPRTDFPMRAQLTRREPQFLSEWEERAIYRQMLQLREGARREGRVRILHDGPPYANGDIHVGTALNKVLKDITVKFWLMRGYYAPFVPGWDTHGLPTELQVVREKGLQPHEVSPLQWRALCRETVIKYFERQREQFRRLGCFGDWEQPYLTLDPAYEAEEIRILGQLGEKGLLYRGRKPIFYCYHCRTALAEAEIEYHPHTSPSIYVAFPALSGPVEGAALLIWTTTPWTLPANAAIAVHPDAQYGIYRLPDGRRIVAAVLLHGVLEMELGVPLKGPEQTFSGSALVGTRYRHPLFPKAPPAALRGKRHYEVIAEDFVDLHTGTGLVHIAPGHGEEDYRASQKWNLPVYSPPDDEGRFPHTPDLPNAIQGLTVEKANPVIQELLREAQALVHATTTQHSYPHCWRCKNPVIFRATPQWFLRIDPLRKDLEEAVRAIAWYPEHGEKRMLSTVQQRPDWCLSRQRLWGVPLPIFYCANCASAIINRDTSERVARIVEKEGSDAWWRYEAKQFLGEEFRCPYCGGKEFGKEKDIVDVWFDSGISHLAVLERHALLRWPADLYLEGSDQYRGWFQTSLITAIALTGRPMTRRIVQHGFVVDEEGRKMSKSLGNVVDPMEITRTYGAEILRLWVAMSDYTEDIRISEAILREHIDAYRKIRNTIRFMLGNLYDFQELDLLPVGSLLEPDRWILAEWHDRMRRIIEAYEKFQYSRAIRLLYDFCVQELSALYLDMCKTRLYTYPPDSHYRRSAQTAISHILRTFLPLIAPVLSFTAEDAWKHAHFLRSRVTSVFLTDIPDPFPEWEDRALLDKWRRLKEVRESVNVALEEAKKEDVIPNRQSARVDIFSEPRYLEFLQQFDREWLLDFFGTAEVHLHPLEELVNRLMDTADREEGFVVSVASTELPRCARCWRHDPTVGDHPDFPELCHRCVNIVARIGAR